MEIFIFGAILPGYMCTSGKNSPEREAKTDLDLGLMDVGNT